MKKELISEIEKIKKLISSLLKEQDNKPTEIDLGDGAYYKDMTYEGDTKRTGKYQSKGLVLWDFTQELKCCKPETVCTQDKAWGFNIDGKLYCDKDKDLILDAWDLWDNFECVKSYNAKQFFWKISPDQIRLVFQYEKDGKFYTFWDNGEVLLSSEGNDWDKVSKTKLKKGKYSC